MVNYAKQVFFKCIDIVKNFRSQFRSFLKIAIFLWLWVVRWIVHDMTIFSFAKPIYKRYWLSESIVEIRTKFVKWISSRLKPRVFRWANNTSYPIFLRNHQELLEDHRLVAIITSWPLSICFSAAILTLLAWTPSLSSKIWIQFFYDDSKCVTPLRLHNLLLRKKLRKIQGAPTGH